MDRILALLTLRGAKGGHGYAIPWSLRLQAMVTLGKLGALDPWLHRINRDTLFHRGDSGVSHVLSEAAIAAEEEHASGSLNGLLRRVFANKARRSGDGERWRRQRQACEKQSDVVMKAPSACEVADHGGASVSLSYAPGAVAASAVILGPGLLDTSYEAEQPEWDSHDLDDVWDEAGRATLGNAEKSVRKSVPPNSQQWALRGGRALLEAAAHGSTAMEDLALSLLEDDGDKELERALTLYAQEAVLETSQHSLPLINDGENSNSERGGQDNHITSSAGRDSGDHRDRLKRRHSSESQFGNSADYGDNGSRRGKRGSRHRDARRRDFARQAAHRKLRGVREEEGMGLRGMKNVNEIAIGIPILNILPSMITDSSTYYPTVAVTGLARVLESPNLQQHHKMASDALMLTFRLLKEQCVPLLPHVMPALLTVMGLPASLQSNAVVTSTTAGADQVVPSAKNTPNLGSGPSSNKKGTDPALLMSLLLEMSKLIRIVGGGIVPFLPDIFALCRHHYSAAIPSVATQHHQLHVREHGSNLEGSGQR